MSDLLLRHATPLTLFPALAAPQDFTTDIVPASGEEKEACGHMARTTQEGAASENNEIPQPGAAQQAEAALRLQSRSMEARIPPGCSGC
ncbi:hypothetical protein NQZ68_025781 [Dissostichus eleginoides]|nr:hypothetical protein NQZ68_025781 [Dissostichus eleginoides]